MSEVRIPGEPVDAAGQDLLAPLQAILGGINVWASSDDIAKGGGVSGVLQGPPDSVAIIEAGATAFSKFWSLVVGALGGTTAIGALVTHFWDKQQGGVRIALLGATGGAVVAMILAIAMIVSSDVRGRAAGAVAQYNARATVASTYLQLTHGNAARSSALPSEQATALIALAASRQKTDVWAKSGQRGRGVRLRPDNVLEVHMLRPGAQDGDWVRLDEVTRFEPR